MTSQEQAEALLKGIASELRDRRMGLVERAAAVAALPEPANAEDREERRVLAFRLGNDEYNLRNAESTIKEAIATAADTLELAAKLENPAALWVKER
jgi:hypothetical protein